MSKPKIFLDSDGVLTNTSKLNCQKLGLKYPSYKDYIDMSNYAWVRDMTTPEEFYKSFKGVKFWESVSPFPWARNLLEYINQLTKGDFVILTRAMNDHGCYAGKKKWWTRHFPEYLGKLVIVGPRQRIVRGEKEFFEGGEKEFFANSEYDILIDDSINNITKWEDAGGSGFWWVELPEDAPNYIVEERKMQIRMLWAQLNKEHLTLV